MSDIAGAARGLPWAAWQRPETSRTASPSALFRYPRLVRDMLGAFVPAEWTAALDLDSLRELPAEFINPKGDKRLGDLLPEPEYAIPVAALPGGRLTARSAAEHVRARIEGGEPVAARRALDAVLRSSEFGAAFRTGDVRGWPVGIMPALDAGVLARVPRARSARRADAAGRARRRGSQQAGPTAPRGLHRAVPIAPVGAGPRGAARAGATGAGQIPEPPRAHTSAR